MRRKTSNFNPPQADQTSIGLLIDRALEFIEGFRAVFACAPPLEFGPMDSTHLAETDKSGLIKEITGAPVDVAREAVFDARGG